MGFAATADTGNAVVYAVKGMFGGFKGEFSAIPYYYKVREYNDFESRDLWEYDLDLRPDELLRMVAHIWELGATHFDYHDASENCSFLMLALLDVAWPDAKLAEQARWPVVPADTLKVALAVPGRLLGVRYRPSLATQFLRRVATLSGDERAVRRHRRGAHRLGRTRGHHPQRAEPVAPLQDDPWTWGGQLEQAQAISHNAALWARWRVDEVRHAGLLGVRWYF